MPRQLRIAQAGKQDDVVPVLRALVSSVLRQRIPVHLDFSETRRIGAEAMLLLSAEVDRVIQLASIEEPITCTPPRNSKACQVLKQVGFFSAIAHNIELTVDSEDVVHWRTARGRLTDSEVAGSFVAPYEGAMAPAVRKKLFGGMVEAMTNSVDHAYRQPRGDGFPHLPDVNWWMFSQERDGAVTVVLCDLGIGIPRSLPLTQPASFLRRMFDSVIEGSPDARSIQVALELGHTQTGRRERGKGLSDIRRVVDSAEHGLLTILSNRGGYLLRKVVGERPIERIFRLKSNMVGTIISWRVPLATGDENE